MVRDRGGDDARLLFKELHDVVFDDEPTDLSWSDLSRLRNVHHMTEIGGASLRDKVSMICLHVDSRSDWLMWRMEATGEFRETRLPRGSVDAAVKDFVAWASQVLVHGH